MDDLIEKIKTIGIITRKRESLPFGNGDRGRFIPPENGRRAIFVPSFGTMEREEVDYMVEAAKEQEDERIKKGKVSLQKAMLEEVTQAVREAPQGQRAKTASKFIKGEV